MLTFSTRIFSLSKKIKFSPWANPCPWRTCTWWRVWKLRPWSPLGKVKSRSLQCNVLRFPGSPWQHPWLLGAVPAAMQHSFTLCQRESAFGLSQLCRPSCNMLVILSHSYSHWPQISAWQPQSPSSPWVWCISPLTPHAELPRGAHWLSV